VLTRREFLAMIPLATPQSPLIIPVNLVLDRQVKLRPEQLGYFWSSIWPQAVRDLESCGIDLQTSVRTAGVERPPGREPILTGLEPSVINFVITDQLPTEWDNGRALSGVTTLYRGHHLCMIALNRAHCHEIPFVSVNTCLHELLHVLLLDVFEDRPKGFRGQAREYRVDYHATLLWLFHDGAAIRNAAQIYVDRMRAPVQKPIFAPGYAVTCSRDSM
jgi:hypothetical protein